MALILALVGAPKALIDMVGGGGEVTQEHRETSPAEDRQADFVSVVLADTEDAWTSLFRAAGKRYEPPRLVMFSEGVESACGMAGSAMGPFYCPMDRKVYLDVGFFHELDRRFGAPGDFAQAYVVAHEVGHHVQTLLGASHPRTNQASVEFELQADCLAGVWANHADRAKKVVEPGDIDEALGAASAIGDDTLQRKTRGRVVPESFTHGSSAQRVAAFRKGFTSGALQACN